MLSIMENIKNEISNNLKDFFKELRDYLDTPLYFYGSVQRGDYFPGKSDIDVDIFTDNETSTLFKLQHFLHIDKKDFKEIIWRLNHNNKVVHGNKVMYKNNLENYSVEISIYNERIKDDILKEHYNKINLPFYSSWLLILVKILYYDLNIINKKVFRYIKRQILTTVIGLPQDEFIILKNMT